MRMFEVGRCDRFLNEAVINILVLAQMRQDPFDCNRFIEPFVTGTPHLADPAGADALFQNIFANLGLLVSLDHSETAVRHFVG